MHKSKGSAIVDYVVPATLIAVVVGAGLYHVLSSGTLLNLIKGSGNIRYIENTGKAVVTSYGSNHNNMPIAGELGGKPDNPVKKCENNMCTIDFGDYIISGLPDNFQEYVENSGNSGGTEVVLRLLEQLERQLAENTDIPLDLVTRIKNMIKRGKEIVAIEKDFEAKYDNYTNQITTYNQYIDSNHDPLTDKYFTADSSLPALKGINLANRLDEPGSDIELVNGQDTFIINGNYSNIANLLDPNIILEYNDGKFTGNVSSIGSVGGFQDYISTSSDLVKQQVEPNQALSPVGQYLKELALLNQETLLPPTIRTLTNTLSEEIYTLSMDAQSKTVNVNTSKNEALNISQAIINMISRQSSSESPAFGLSASSFSTFVELNEDLEKLINSPSTETDVDLKIICRTHGGDIDQVTKTCEKQK